MIPPVAPWQAVPLIIAILVLAPIVWALDKMGVHVEL